MLPSRGAVGVSTKAELYRTGNHGPRLRYYVCPKCHTSKGNPQVLMEKLIANAEKADAECDKCETRFPLWDALERKFASDAARRQVEELPADDFAKLMTRRIGKLFVLDVGARITSANQKWMEAPGDAGDANCSRAFTNAATGAGARQRVRRLLLRLRHEFG